VVIGSCICTLTEKTSVISVKSVSTSMEVIQKQNMLCCHCTAISKLFIPPLNNTFAIKKKIKISPSRIEIKAGE